MKSERNRETTPGESSCAASASPVRAACITDTTSISNMFCNGRLCFSLFRFMWLDKFDPNDIIQPLKRLRGLLDVCNP